MSDRKQKNKNKKRRQQKVANSSKQHPARSPSSSIDKTTSPSPTGSPTSLSTPTKTTARSGKVAYSMDAVTLCRTVEATLPRLHAVGSTSNNSLVGSSWEMGFFVLHFMLIHLVLHGGFEFGAGLFTWIVMTVSVGVTFAWLQFTKDRFVSGELLNDFVFIFTFVAPFVAVFGSVLRLRFVSDPYFAHPSAPTSNDLVTSVGWLILPAAFHFIVPPLLINGIGPFAEKNINATETGGGKKEPSVRTSAVSPSFKADAKKKNSYVAPLSHKDHQFVTACLNVHDANVTPSFLHHVLRIAFRSFKCAFWSVIAPCVMQTWAPLYYNKNVCYVAFFSAWLGSMTLGLIDMMRTRVPRLLDAIRLQGFWRVGRGNSSDEDRNAEGSSGGGGGTNKMGANGRIGGWDSTICYNDGDVVSANIGNTGTVVYYTAAVAWNGDGGRSSKSSGGTSLSSPRVVFTDPSTVNGTIVRFIGNSPKRSLGQIRSFILSLQVMWSIALVVCCVVSPFAMWYCALLMTSCYIFHISNAVVYPNHVLLKSIEKHENMNVVCASTTDSESGTSGFNRGGRGGGRLGSGSGGSGSSGSRNGTGGSDFEKIDQPPVVISNTDHQQAMEDEKKNM